MSAREPAPKRLLLGSLAMLAIDPSQTLANAPETAPISATAVDQWMTTERGYEAQDLRRQ